MEKFYILWCPTSSFPSKNRFSSLGTACKVAIEMCQKYPGENYYVMEQVGEFIGTWIGEFVDVGPK